MMIFYLCRNKPWLGAIIYTLTYLPALNGYMEDPLALKIGGHAIGFEIFALLALPFIYIHTKSDLKISKWFFYIYYPAHLFAIFLFNFLFKNCEIARQNSILFYKGQPRKSTVLFLCRQAERSDHQ